MATAPTDTAFLTVVRAALRAPSLHNSQPWRFRLRDDAVEIRVDRTRRVPVADPRDWGVRLACGAAAFNARLALTVLGQGSDVRLRPDLADRDLMIRLQYTGQRPATPTEQRLYAAIPRRHSSRTPFWPTPVDAEARARLLAAARAEGAWLDLIIGTSAVAAVAEVARAAGQVLDRDPAYRMELASWTRPDNSTGDGVPGWAGGPSPEPSDLLPGRAFSSQPRAPGRDYELEPLVAVLGTAGDTANDQLTAGIALQRLLLTVTDAGLAASMMSQPIEVPAAREELRLALRRHGTPQMVLRIGHGQPGFATPRRDPAEVIDP